MSNTRYQSTTAQTHETNAALAAVRGRVGNERSIKSREQFSQYLANYRFERDPFADVGTSGLFFSGGGRRQAVESLQHYLRYGTAPVFLTGHIGSGKSTVLKAFISELESDVDLSNVQAVLMMTPGQFFAAVAEGFAINQTARGAMDLASISQHLLDFIAGNAANERQSLICIDNVQDLTTEVISAIFDLLAASRGELQILFAGEKQAASLLEVAAERVGMLLNQIELPVFDQQTVHDYVRYRLDSVGYSGEYPLSEMQLQALSYRSQGSLSQLHHVARSMLVAGMDSAKPERSPFPLPHLLALIFLSIIITVSWRHEDNVQPAGEPEPIVLEGLVNRGVDSGSTGISLVEGDADTAALVNDDSATGDNPDSAAKTRAEIKAALNSLAQNPSSDAAAVNTLDPVNAKESLADMPATVVLAGSQQDVAVVNGSANTSVDALDEAGVNTQTGSVEAKAEVKKAAIASVDNQAAIDQASGAQAMASSGNSASSSQAAIKVESAHKRLMAWSELGYALQIFGTHNAKRAKQLVDEYFGSADLLFYETRHNGKPWFVVVNGPYSGRQAARLSIEQLPESLQRLRPWPRNIASIQADIRRYGAAIAADQ